MELVLLKWHLIWYETGQRVWFWNLKQLELSDIPMMHLRWQQPAGCCIRGCELAKWWDKQKRVPARWRKAILLIRLSRAAAGFLIWVTEVEISQQTPRTRISHKTSKKPEYYPQRSLTGSVVLLRMWCIIGMWFDLSNSFFSRGVSSPL